MSAAAPPRRRSLLERFDALGLSQIYGVLLVVLAVTWGAILLTGGNINVTNTLVRSVALGIVAVGQTYVILGGSLDLSVAYQISVTAILASVLMDGSNARILPALLAVLAVGVVIGAANGIIITKLRVNAFIATLGTSLILRGLLNATVTNFAGEVPSPVKSLAWESILGIPLSIFLLLAVVFVGWWILRATRFGHHLYAVGAGEDVARLSGVRSDLTLVMAHVFCSITAVLTGLFVVSRLGSGAPWVGPDGNYDLESIAAVVLGGTALTGGRGGVLGTFAGVLILALLDNAFNQLQINPLLRDVVRGAIIIVAVAAYTVRQRSRVP